MSQGCALLILRSKGQRSRSWRMVIWKWFPDDNWLFNQPMIMKLHTLTHHESRMCPIDFEVKRVKGQGHGAWLFENGFRTITDSVINQWSWNFIHLLTMSQGCALLILRSKGQRSRSWRMVISPPPVKPEGTIGLHSVCLSVSLSVRQSVCPSH